MHVQANASPTMIEAEPTMVVFVTDPDGTEHQFDFLGDAWPHLSATPGAVADIRFVD